MSGEISAIGPTSVARTSPPTTLPPDPVETAKAMIADNRSARTGINYGELLRDIDQLSAKAGVFGQQVENAIKAELGPVATKKLMNASYSIRAKDGSTLVMARNAPSIEQYYKGTAHASLGKTPQERAAYAASDKAHYARLDKLFGDGKVSTYEGTKIQEGLNDLLSRGYTLDQIAQYKAEKAAEAKAAEAANQGPTNTQVALDLTQMALDLAGIVDPTGIADGGNAVISLGRSFSSLFSGEWKDAGGHFVNGLISVAGILPYIGDLAKAGKFGKWVQTVTDAITLAAKNPALAAKFGEALKEIRTLLNKIPQSAIDALPADAKKSLMALKTKLDNFFNAGAKGKIDLSKVPVGELNAKLLGEKLDSLNVASKADTAIFYSGRGAREAAEKHASATGKTTLETTSGGKYLDDLKLFDGTVPDVNNDAAMGLWSKLSTRYAAEAKGSVTAFINNPRPGSIFLTKELPALLSNGNVTEILVKSGNGQSVLIPKGTSLADALAMIGKIQ